MRPFEDFASLVVPLLVDNVDTDQIIPARFLKGTDRAGLAAGLFAGWRHEGKGSGDAFVLDQPRYRGAEILLAGENFGCGSSREHAAWALAEAGIRAVLSTRFADIFRNNALGNGLLPITLEPQAFGALAELATAPEALVCRVELSPQRLSWGEGEEVFFEIEPFAKGCLQRGEDRLGYLLSQLPRIEAYEAAHPARVDTRIHQRPQESGRPAARRTIS